MACARHSTGTWANRLTVLSHLFVGAWRPARLRPSFPSLISEPPSPLLCQLFPKSAQSKLFVSSALARLASLCHQQTHEKSHSIAASAALSSSEHAENPHYRS